jgi:hypothetical protein
MKVAEKENNAFLMFMYGMLVFLVVSGLMVVLLYASVLLISRAIAFIFLLITSSLAFATYLNPTLAKSDYGWHAWWGVLLRNAILAPVLLLFLKAVLDVSDALVHRGAGSTPSGLLGNLISKPEDNIGALFNYVLILGLMYAAVRISSMLSSAAAMRVVGGSIMAPIGITAAALGFGWTYRNYRAQKTVENKMKDIKRDPSLSVEQKQRRLGYLSDVAAKYKKAASRDFNLLNTDAAKNLSKAVFGNSGILAGQTKLPSYAKVVENQGKKLSERAQKLELSKEDESALRKTTTEQHEVAKEIRKQAQEAASAAKSQKEAADSQKKTAEQQLKQAQSRHDDGMDKIQRENAEDNETLTRAGASEERQRAASDRIQRNVRRAQELASQRTQAEQTLADALSDKTDYDAKIRNANTVLDKAVAAEKEAFTAVKAVEAHINEYNQTLNKHIKQMTWNSDIANEAIGQIKKHHKQERIKDFAAATGIKAEEGDHASTPTAEKDH